MSHVSFTTAQFENMVKQRSLRRYGELSSPIQEMNG